MTGLPLGSGIGLRTQHFAHLLEHNVSGVSWMEVVSENFFEAGGRPWAVLERVRAQVPIALHGVSMAIGDAHGVPNRYLDRLSTLIARVEPKVVSDHLCWGTFGGHYGHDLWPLHYTEETLAQVVTQVGRVQERLRRQILLENPSSYVAFAASTIPEWEFLAEVACRSGCGILLDVNNIYVSSINHGFSWRTYVEHIDPESVGYFHLAGHTDKKSYLLDSHVGPVPEVVWEVYRYALTHIGRKPALIEWDEDVPAYEVVVAEAAKAESAHEELRIAV